ncbi:MAG: YggT family protein [Gammaproteobacteria bacterium]|jgi:YggT family protein|nr:YggT family protein [Gammaproteobacteria bacterium]
MQFQVAFAHLLETLFSLFAALVVMRGLLQWSRGDYFNPVSKIIVKLTDPVLAPMRKLLPAIGRIDTASVIMVLLLQWMAVNILLWPVQHNVSWLTGLHWALLKSLHLLLMTWLILIFANVVISWLGQQTRHPIIPLIYQLSEPLLRPIRRILPTLGGLDFSPLVVILLLQFLMILIGWSPRSF